MKTNVSKCMTVQTKAGGIAPPETDKRLLVMLVDDDRLLSALLAMALQKRGDLRVIRASSGREALDMLAQRKPDLILLDISMPDMNGHEVMHKIKEDRRLASVPIVMLTCRMDEKDVVGAMEDGAVNYLIKPVDPEFLVKKVDEILAHRRREIDDNDTRVLQILDYAYKYGS